MASEGKLYNRALFYERVPNPGRGGERIRFMPFFLVSLPILGGRLFEPVDYARGDITEEKEIHQMRFYRELVWTDEEEERITSREGSQMTSDS